MDSPNLWISGNWEYLLCRYQMLLGYFTLWPDKIWLLPITIPCLFFSWDLLTNRQWFKHKCGTVLIKKHFPRVSLTNIYDFPCLKGNIVIFHTFQGGYHTMKLRIIIGVSMWSKWIKRSKCQRKFRNYHLL